MNQSEEDVYDSELKFFSEGLLTVSRTNPEENNDPDVDFIWPVWAIAAVNLDGKKHDTLHLQLHDPKDPASTNTFTFSSNRQAIETIYHAILTFVEHYTLSRNTLIRRQLDGDSHSQRVSWAKTAVFEPGSLGITCSPVVRSGDLAIGCRVEELPPGQAQLTERVRVGDIVVSINDINVQTLPFSNILTILKETQGEQRTIQFKDLTANWQMQQQLLESTSAMQDIKHEKSFFIRMKMQEEKGLNQQEEHLHKNESHSDVENHLDEGKQVDFCLEMMLEDWRCRELRSQNKMSKYQQVLEHCTNIQARVPSLVESQNKIVVSCKLRTAQLETKIADLDQCISAFELSNQEYHNKQNILVSDLEARLTELQSNLQATKLQEVHFLRKLKTLEALSCTKEQEIDLGVNDLQEEYQKLKHKMDQNTDLVQRLCMAKQQEVDELREVVNEFDYVLEQETRVSPKQGQTYACLQEAYLLMEQNVNTLLKDNKKLRKQCQQFKTQSRELESLTRENIKLKHSQQQQKEEDDDNELQGLEEREKLAQVGKRLQEQLNKIQNLRGQIHHLNQQNQVYQQSISTLQVQNESLAHELQQKQEEHQEMIIMLQKQLEQQQESIEALKTQEQAHQHQSKEAATREQDFLEQMSSLETQHTLDQDDMQHLQREIQHLKEQVHEYEKAKSSLHDQHQQEKHLEEQWTQYESQKEKGECQEIYDEKIALFQQQHARDQDTIEELRHEVNDHENQAQEYKDTIAKMQQQQQLLQAQQQQDHTQTQQAVETFEISSLQQQHARDQQIIQHLQQELEQQFEQIQEQDKVMDRAQSKHHQEQQQASQEFENKAAQQEETIRVLEKKLHQETQMVQSLKESVQAHERQKQADEETILKFEQQVSKHAEELNKLVHEKCDYKERLCTMEQQLNQQKQLHQENLKHLHLQHQQALKAAMQEYQQDQRLLQSLKENQLELKQKAKQAQDEVRSLLDLFREKEHVYAEKVNKLVQAHKEEMNKSLAEQDNYRRELDSFQSEASYYKQEEKELRRQVSIAREDQEHITLELQLSQKKTKELQDTHLQDQQEYQKLKHRVQQLQAIRIWQSVTFHLQHQEQLQTKSKEAVYEVHRVQQAMRELHQEVADTTQHLTEAQVKICELQTEQHSSHSQYKIEKEKLEHEIRCVRNAKLCMEETAAHELQQMKQELQSHFQHEIQEQSTNYQAQIENLRQEKTHFETQVQDLQKKLRREREAFELRRKTQEQQHEADRKEFQTRVQNQLEEEKQQWQQKYTSCSQCLGEMEVVCLEAKSKLLTNAQTQQELIEAYEKKLAWYEVYLLETLLHVAKHGFKRARDIISKELKPPGVVHLDFLGQMPEMRDHGLDNLVTDITLLGLNTSNFTPTQQLDQLVQESLSTWQKIHLQRLETQYITAFQSSVRDIRKKCLTELIQIEQEAKRT